MTVIIKIGSFLLNMVYALFKLLPIKRKITMISRQSNEPSIEFRMLQKEIQKRDDSVEVVLLCHTLDGGASSTSLTRIKYGFHMIRQMFHIATSKVVILDTYCMVISILRHKKDLKIIQMWHSMGTMKKFGYTALDTEEGSSHELAYAMKMHQNYDYVFASSDAYKGDLAKGFRCDMDKILTMPLPRLDLLNSQKYAENIRGKIYRRYPELKDKPIILYCPTFRKDERRFEQAVYNLADAVDYGKYQLVVKLHPLSKVCLNERVIQAEEFSSFDMLFVADYVISDYSCIIYEAAVLQKPLYFYNFDMELYTGGRGLAIDYDNELPGTISGDAKEIIRAIERADYDMEELKRFADKYVRPVENATGNIVDFIWKFL